MTGKKKWGDQSPSKRISFPQPDVYKTITFIYQEPYKDANFLRQKYLEERMSISEIAAEISSSASTIHKYLQKFRIPVRPADSKNRSRLSYGEKWKARKVEDHKREQAVIAQIHIFREQGFSYWKIADILNTMRVPTKTRRGKWHARSVQSCASHALYLSDKAR